MKLVQHLLLSWAAAFGLMLISVGVLGSFYDRTELLEITGGSGFLIYLLWGIVLSVCIIMRHYWKKWN